MIESIGMWVIQDFNSNSEATVKTEIAKEEFDHGLDEDLATYWMDKEDHWVVCPKVY